MSTHRLKRFVAARLSPEGALGLHLTAGVALLLVAVIAFREVAAAVAGSAAIVRFDVQVATWFNAHAVEPATTILFAITHLHGIPAMSVAGGLLALWFWRRGARYWALATAIAVPGGMVLNVVLKHAYERVRPAFEEPLLALATYSFPSGHTAAATVFYGLLASYAVTVSTSRTRRAAAVLGAVLMVLLVAFSRVYLGAHFVTDVAAAMVESAGWLAVCITGVSTLRRRREAGRAR